MKGRLARTRRRLRNRLCSRYSMPSPIGFPFVLTAVFLSLVVRSDTLFDFTDPLRVDVYQETPTHASCHSTWPYVLTSTIDAAHQNLLADKSKL
jgi:hypothetical protein